jgi:hypothetical protein
MIGQTALHYKILEHLGSGGMDVVCKVEDDRRARVWAPGFPVCVLQGCTIGKSWKSAG